MNAKKTDVVRRLADAELKPPIAATIAVTNRCNLNCGHCWPESGPDETSPEVSTKQVLRLIKDFAALGAEKFVITGGEPLTHPGWLDILTFACNLPGIVEVRLQTNSILITPAHVDAFFSLKDRGLVIQTSLEGAAAASHDRVRGKGSFQGTLKGLRLLEKSGLSNHVCITFTEMQHNFEDIPALLNLADDIGIGQFVTGALVAGGRAAASSGLAAPTPAQYEDLLARYRTDKDFRDRYQRIGNISALEWFKTTEGSVDACCDLIETPYVTADGNLYPCVMLHAEDFMAKNIYEGSLAASVSEKIDSWSRLQQIKKFRITQLSDCKFCSHYSICGAGCMGRAYSIYGDFFAKEDRCRHRQTVYDRRFTKR